MNAKATSYPPRLILFCLTILICAGCQSFRTGEYSYQELERRNQEQRETGKMEFKPEPERPFQRWAVRWFGRISTRGWGRTAR